MRKSIWIRAGLIVCVLNCSAPAADFLFAQGGTKTQGGSGFWGISTPVSLAQAILYNDLSGNPYLASSKENTLYGPQGESGFRAWHLSQWGIKEDLPDSTDCLGDCTDGTWQTANQYGSLLVVRNGGHYLWQMSHSKSLSEYPCMHEVDMFAETTNGGVNATFPGGDYPGYPDALTHVRLSDLASLTLEATQRVVSVSQGHTCPYPYDLASTMLAFFFENTADRRQRFYYQIITYDSRGLYPPPSGWWFPAGDPQWWGVNDGAPTYGQPYLTPGGTSYRYRMNIYDRVVGFIKSGRVSESGRPLDSDLSHWELHSIYLGSYIDGEASITSQVSRVKVY
jgi:hypothetical protein